MIRFISKPLLTQRVPVALLQSNVCKSPPWQLQTWQYLSTPGEAGEPAAKVTKKSDNKKQEKWTGDLFDDMLGNWDTDKDDIVDRAAKPGETHAEVEGLGTMSAAGGAFLATFGALVVFVAGVSCVFGTVYGISSLIGPQKRKRKAAAEPVVDTPALEADLAQADLTRALTPLVQLQMELERLRMEPRSPEVDSRKASIKTQLKTMRNVYTQ
ncbi:hypothetical protein CYMTET_49579 [Cymbomonas tetramitiformis]|uniref:Transmembrane protein n=1 Tax=Cymbomonas tetramitiformis TaxID=36881 RepID=A0AAE0EUE8_9CHLO|nr:hypothetical protein CYMTET_49579 [Cymbomonas tetramitiformis]